MDTFYQGLIAGVAILGGLCAFNYWVFGLFEKRIEMKIDMKLDAISLDIHKIADELKEERRSKDYLYKFVMEYVKGK